MLYLLFRNMITYVQMISCNSDSQYIDMFFFWNKWVWLISKLVAGTLTKVATLSPSRPTNPRGKYNHLFEQVLSSLDKFHLSRTLLSQFGRVWSNLDKFKPIWTSLNQFGQVWINLEMFHPKDWDDLKNRKTQWPRILGSHKYRETHRFLILGSHSVCPAPSDAFPGSPVWLPSS